MIYPCKPNEFLENVEEIKSFIFAMKSNLEINNADKLINLLNSYFETILYYKRNSTRKYIVNLKNREFEIKFEGTNIEGEPYITDMIDAINSILKNIFKYLLNCIQIEDFEKLQKIIISILETKSISIIEKIALLNEDELIFNGVNDNFYFRINETIALDSINTRIEVLYDFFAATEIHSTFENSEVSYKKFDLYIKQYLRNCIYRNHFTDGINFLLKELDRFDNIDENIQLDDNELVFIVLNRIISYNHLFQLKSKEKIKEIIDNFNEFLSDASSKTIYDNLNFNPNNFSIEHFDLELHEPDFSNINLEEIYTHIIFVLQLEDIFDNYETSSNDVRITINKLDNLTEDPIFNLLSHIDIQLEGMPIAILSDAVGNIHNSYIVEIKQKSFYHPDFNLVNNKIEYKDLSIEDARHGGKYYPHKDFILDQLLSVQQQEDAPLKFKNEKITSNFISNYLVSYSQNGTDFHHKAYTITNFNSYFKIKNKYFEIVNQFEFNSQSDFSDFIFNTDILNHKQFYEFCICLIQKTIQKSIELGGMHKNLWNDDGLNPVSETKAQKLLFNQIRYVAELKGISISRECVSANGSLDFYFQYTKNDRVLKVCVELKNAHHQKIESGNNTQLIEYIKDIGYKYGIYLVLWYKGGNYRKPENYTDISDLEKKLNNNAVGNFKVKNIIIDCSFDKTSPSKL
jgi:hypothetical protein